MLTFSRSGQRVRATAPARSARENVLRVATGLARARGLENFSITDVTNQLGLSKSMFYERFDTRTELIVEMLIEYSSSLLRDAEAAGRAAPKGIRRLVRILELWLGNYVLQESGCLIVSGTIECAGRPNDAIRNAMMSAVQAWRAYLNEQLRDAAALGEIPGTVDIVQLEFEIYSFVLGMQHDCIFLGEPASFRSEAFAAILNRHGVRLPLGVSLRI